MVSIVNVFDKYPSFHTNEQELMLKRGNTRKNYYEI